MDMECHLVSSVYGQDSIHSMYEINGALRDQNTYFHNQADIFLTYVPNFPSAFLLIMPYFKCSQIKSQCTVSKCKHGWGT